MVGFGPVIACVAVLEDEAVSELGSAAEVVFDAGGWRQPSS